MKSFVISAALVGLTSPALAGQFMSAHFCQPYQHGGNSAVELYYQNQGSILAARDTTVMCPIQVSNPNAQQHVKVYYQSVGVTTAPAVSCTFWKISSANLSQVSPVVKGLQGQNAGAFDIYSPNGSADTIGFNLQCNLKQGAKILSYFVY